MSKKVPKKKNAGYKMPDPIPNGEIIEAMNKTKWIIGASIGVGGFGEIYSAAEYKDKKPTTYPYVVKIEPHGNGPLFVEMHFYMRNAKPDDVNAWKTTHKLKSLGMPLYIASGSHQCNDIKYRFVVMERFGQDLWKLYLENNKCFPEETVFKLGVQLLDVLEYIHSRGYVHADIKGANILLGMDKSRENQVYLVDFGLAAHYSTKDFKPDPKKAHNGTIEYTSRDAHHGVPTRRGDLEILGYNLIHWLGCTLPWESCLSDPTAVQNMKVKFMDSVENSLKKCFVNKMVPDNLKKFMVYVSKMEHDTEPDYVKCRSYLVSGVESCGVSLSSPLQFITTSSKKASSPSKRKSDVATNGEVVEKKRRVKKKTEEPQRDENINKKSKKKIANPEVTNNCSPSPKPGYTAEMLRVKKKLDEKKNKSKKTKSSSTSASSNSEAEELIIPATPEEDDVKVIRGRSKRAGRDKVLQEVAVSPTQQTTPIRKPNTRHKTKTNFYESPY